jgi:hypothetical protein
MNNSEDNSANLELAHRHSSGHRDEVLASELCGCFFCCQTFPPSEIEHWLNEAGGTALCPRCAVESVIGSRSGFALTQEFLQEMHDYWF